MILQEHVHRCFSGGSVQSFSGLSLQESCAVGSVCVASLNSSELLPGKLSQLTFPREFVFLHLKQHLRVSNFLRLANLIRIRPVSTS